MAIYVFLKNHEQLECVFHNLSFLSDFKEQSNKMYFALYKQTLSVIYVLLYCLESNWMKKNRVFSYLT